MEVLRANKKLVMVLIMLFIIASSTVISAKELSLKEVIEIGLENNSEIRLAREDVEELQRNLAIILARQDWQVDLAADYSYLDRDLTEKSGMDLSISKSFSSGFTLNPTISVIQDEFGSDDYTIEVSQPLLASLPTDLQQDYFRNSKNLLAAEKNLNQQKSSQILSWLDDYLHLCRMIEKRDMYNKAVEKAQENLAQVLQEQKIGEAGKNDLLTAQVSLQEAQYVLEDTKKELEEGKLSLANALGLSGEQTIKISSNISLISEIKEKVNQLTVEHLKQTDLLKLVENNSYDVYANLIEKEILQQELAWLKKDNLPELNLIGGYSNEGNEYSGDDIDGYYLGFSTSYTFYDSGEHALKLKDKEAEISSNQQDYQDLINNLKEKLKEYLNTIELAKMNLEKQELTVEKNKHELAIAEQQLAIGYIDYLEYQEYYLDAMESEVELASLKDQLFINNFKFVNFINLSSNDIINIFTE
ncbi:hypothetical protein GM661_14750 [Iocasia frigidifontis]|uniref:Outer membrane protein TolC n=1 Tax=Iocasia fonsfrigidae TaxID=2682810 RepID=A0A8A7KGA5_9FIRM|nr:TolC family protein [Iocasia fonsfrigidae]QTL99125.1 hypothetical protein GM661_14750 [Iocasia fonsfrigidae]